LRRWETKARGLGVSAVSMRRLNVARYSPFLSCLKKKERGMKYLGAMVPSVAKES
jgi:hypothetical protein